MKKWFFIGALLFFNMAYAWDSVSYGKSIRSTIAEMDAYYTDEMKSIYASELTPKLKQDNAKKVQDLWTLHREQVISDMRLVQKELAMHERNRLDSSVKIRAKLQQALNELLHWRNSELAKLQNASIGVELKERNRQQLNTTYDLQIKKLQESAYNQEKELRRVYQLADRVMFSPTKDSSAFALKGPN